MSYDRLLSAARSTVIADPLASVEARQKVCIDLLWKAFAGRWSWVGFYEKVPDADEMVLVCREPKPACSPIGLHGMCGRCWRDRRPIIVADVRALGSGYIACDPRDLSELVVPIMYPDGSCRGVLDADSYEPGAFSQSDAEGCAAILETLALSAPISRAALSV